MSIGLSLHIGVNLVDSKHYDGWSGPFNACKNDAHSMASICKAEKLKPTALLTAAATRETVLQGIASAAAKLEAGELFVLSYAGHGGQVPDVSGDEPDLRDETCCLYDARLIEDELYLALAAFKPGTRVLVLSDSCHSGTVVRQVLSDAPVVSAGPASRLMPAGVASGTYFANKDLYDDLQAGIRDAGYEVVEPGNVAEAVTQRAARVRSTVAGDVVLISGCQDNQESLDGPFNGAFTERLLAVWNYDAFKGAHSRSHKQILAGLPPSRSTNLFTLGNVAGLLSQRPFTI